MTNKLKKIEIEEVKSFVKSDIIKKIKEQNQPIFIAGETHLEIEDSLLDLEITLRKGERIGFFQN